MEDPHKDTYEGKTGWRTARSVHEGAAMGGETPAATPAVVTASAAQARAAPSLAINNFVGQYYQTSTFHHLSSWKARLQEFTSSVASGQARPDVSANLKGVATARRSTTSSTSSTAKEPNEGSPTSSQASQSSSPEDGSDRRPPAGSTVLTSTSLPVALDRLILAHVDMDAFYVSVAIRDNPTLVGRPVVVCPSKNVNGTSEVSTCSYAARKYGIKPRMFVRDARALCPDLICLPCDYEKYEKVSQQIYQIFLKYSNRVQAVSADEAFLDLSSYDDPEDAVAKLRKDIYHQTGCPASAGISHNMLLARLATEKAKPAGQFYLKEEMVEEFMTPLNVDQLPGVGPSLTDKLHQRRIHTVGELRRVSQDWLEKEFGKKKGEMLFKYARGIDERSFQPVHARKSIGTQLSWGIRFTEKEQVRSFLNDVAKEVSKRMKEAKVKGTRINLKIKRRKPGGNESEKVFNPGDIIEVNRSRTILFFTDDWEVIAKEALTLFVSMLIPPSEVRGVGLFVDKLDTEATEGSKAQGGVMALDHFFSKKEKTETSVASKESEQRTDAHKDPPERKPDTDQNPEAEAEAEEEVVQSSMNVQTHASKVPAKRKSADEEEVRRLGGGGSSTSGQADASDRVTSPSKRPKTSPGKPPAKSPGRKANKALGGNVSPGKQVTLAQMFGRQSPS